MEQLTPPVDVSSMFRVYGLGWVPQWYPFALFIWGLLIKAEHKENGYPDYNGLLRNLGMQKYLNSKLVRNNGLIFGVFKA